MDLGHNVTGRRLESLLTMSLLQVWLLIAFLAAVVVAISEVVRRRTQSLAAGLATLVGGGIAGYSVFILVLLITSY